MPGVSEEQIARAKEVDLLAYLQANEPDVLMRQGAGRYTLRDHDSFVISNGKWRWNSRGYGRKTATALGYLMDVRGLGFVAAVETLTGKRAAVISAYQAKQPDVVEKPAFYPPRSVRCATAMVSYLHERGIHSDVIGRCMSLGILAESRYWNPKSPYHNAAVCAFLGKDVHGEVRFAALRGISTDLKQDKSGCDKRYYFIYPAQNPHSRHLMVFESPIDALSHATFQRRNAWNHDPHRLSLGGTSSVSLIAFLERNPQIRRVILHLDSDVPGIIAAKKIKAELAADSRFSHIRVSVNPARGSKDFNEVLLHAIRLEREQKQQIRSGKGADISL